MSLTERTHGLATRGNARPRASARQESPHICPPQIRDGPRVVSCGLSTSCRVDVSPDVIALPGLLCAGEEGRAASCGEASGIVSVQPNEILGLV